MHHLFILLENTQCNKTVLSTQALTAGFERKFRPGSSSARKQKTFQIRAILLERAYVTACGRTTTPPVHRLGRRGDSVAIVSLQIPVRNTFLFNNNSYQDY